MLDTELAISFAFSTAVLALPETIERTFVAFSLVEEAADVSPERSTLFTRFVSPLITEFVLVLVIRLLEPSTSPAAKSL